MKSPIDNFDAEQDRIARLIDVAEDVHALTDAVCTGCQEAFDKTSLWWTPQGSLCRRCYTARYGEVKGGR